jgi:hypothetical protein
MKRIDLLANRGEWWQPGLVNSRYGAEPGRQLYINARCIAVDPACTAPNVIVAVTPSIGDPPVYLRPGELLVLPATVQSVQVWNPLIAQLRTVAAEADKLLSAVSLLTGNVDDLVAWKARANRTRPAAVPSMIAAAQLPVAAGSVYVPCVGLEKLRLRFVPVTALGVPLVAPADLAGTIRLTGVETLGFNASTALDRAVFLGQNPDNGSYQSAGVGEAAYLMPDAASDFALSQFQLCMDYEVGAGQKVGIHINGLAGAAVGAVWVLVNGS